MADIVDFHAYRAIRLLGGLSRQTVHVKAAIAENQEMLSAVMPRLETCIETLAETDLRLQEHLAVCETVKKRNRECLSLLERDDYEELISFRQAMVKAVNR